MFFSKRTGLPNPTSQNRRGTLNGPRSTLDKTILAMRKLKKEFKPVVYKGAGHGFLRAGEAPGANKANKSARAIAWKRWIDLLKKV